MSDLPFFEKYSGQTVEQLLALEGEYRTDSLVCAFEGALLKKALRDGDRAINDEERVVLAVEALEREVNNGGYSLFFENSSREFAPIIVQALVRIGCPRTAEITQSAINALHLPTLSVEAIEAALAGDNVSEEDLDGCDQSYFKGPEDIAGRLFAFIKTNKNAITL